MIRFTKFLGVWLAIIGVTTLVVPAAEPPSPYTNVVALRDAHDRSLLRELRQYIESRPKAEDLDQAYQTLFQTVIDHDWFVDHEDLARDYLKSRSEGMAAPLARIISVMGRARSKAFDDAVIAYQDLMRSIGGPEQEDFAQSFTEALASAAAADGKPEVARRVYELLGEKYASSSEKIREKVNLELARLDRVGKPSPELASKDLKNESISLKELKGKYVLIDFWATWCAPCLTELPNLESTYKTIGSKNLEIVSVSLDETAGAVTDFLKARPLAWRQVHNATCGADWVAAFGVGSIPATVLIDPKGVVSRIDLRGPDLEATLKALIQ